MKLLAFLILFTGYFFSAIFSANAVDSNFFEDTYLEKACFLTGSADPETGKAKSNVASKYVRPMTARVVECIDGTMSNLFLKPNPKNGFTLFQEFQSVVKPMIILALILYIAFNGYLIATGQLMKEKPKQEIIMFVIKFILVFYFSIGDAWKDFFFVALRSISSTLGTILIEAGANTTSDACIFTGYGASPYPIGKGYIALFDTLDCKFANYMGWFVGRKFPVLVPIGITMFFIGGIGPVLFTIVFVLTVQLIVLAARITQLYLISIMVLTLLIYASPIMVPMVLFNYTKSMFEKWLSKILSLCVHPVLVFAFVGILLSVTDRIYYGTNPDANKLFLPTASFSQYKENGNEVLTLNPPLLLAQIVATGAKQEQAEIAIENAISDINKIKGISMIASGGMIVFNVLEGAALTAVNGVLSGLQKKFNTNNLLKNSNALEGADVNPKCYNGPKFDFTVPLVCIMGWLEGTASTIAFPVPYFLEILEFYIPYRVDLAIIFFVVAALCIVLNLIVGTIFEKLEELIDSISGAGINQFAHNISMMEATKSAAQSGMSGMQNAQDSALKRASGNQEGGERKTPGQNENNAKGKGGQNENNATSGGGQNENSATSGGSAGDAASSGGDAAGGAADAASNAG